MELRMLGRSGLKVSTLCLGGNVFGWTIDEKRSIELLNAFVGAGFNFIDIPPTYIQHGSQGIGVANPKP